MALVASVPILIFSTIWTDCAGICIEACCIVALYVRHYSVWFFVGQSVSRIVDVECIVQQHVTVYKCSLEHKVAWLQV